MASLSLSQTLGMKTASVENVRQDLQRTTISKSEISLISIPLHTFFQKLMNSFNNALPGHEC